MAHRRELTPDELANTIVDGRSLAFARVLSFVFSPPLVAIASYVLVANMQPLPANESFRWSLLSLAIQLMPAALLYTYRRQTGAYHDADVSRRQDRNELYLLGAASVLLSVVVLSVLGAPSGFIALAAGSFGLAVVCGVVNLFWKISMHGAAIGAFATVAALMSASFGVVMWAFALAVGWARVRTRNHTVWQVVAGLMAAAVITVASFTLIG
jgi:membrane-associated phospholipid phosphatase